MRTVYVLVDFESLPLKSLAVLNGEQFHVKVFLGPNNKNVPTDLVLDLHKMAGRGEYVVLEESGKNALDFYITYHLGELVAQNPGATFYIISKDKGFDSLLKHISARNVSCQRVTALDQVTANQGAPQNKKVQPPKPVSVPPTPVDEELVKQVITDLIKRKAARPRTSKTLINTIRNTCGKDCPQSSIDNIIAALVQRRHLKIDGTKITYSFPSK